MHESVFSDSLFSSLLEEPIIDVDGLGATNGGLPELEGLVTDVAAAAVAVDGEGVAVAAAAWLDLEPRSLAQLNLRPQLPFLDFVPDVVDDDEFVPELPLPLLLHSLLLLFAWLAQLELRQHLHTRDFLPDDVSELSSVAAVDVAGGAIVLVVVVSSGCRQQAEEDNDVVAPVAAAFGAAGDGDAVTDDTVLVDSFVLLPWVVFNIFSSHSPIVLCRTDAITQRGHSPALDGCSSLL